MSRERNASVLVDLLAHSLGPHAAKERVFASINKLKLDPHKLSESDALLVLDDLAREKGIIGTSARFSRARLMLVWTQD
ncbi:MAG: hypothetical protein U0269_22235 [Polyangiales bacterium]